MQSRPSAHLVGFVLASLLQTLCFAARGQCTRDDVYLDNTPYGLQVSVAARWTVPHASRVVTVHALGHTATDTFPTTGTANAFYLPAVATDWVDVEVGISYPDTTCAPYSVARKPMKCRPGGLTIPNEYPIFGVWKGAKHTNLAPPEWRIRLLIAVKKLTRL